MTNETEIGMPITSRSSGLDTMLPPAQEMEQLVERMAMRMHGDKCLSHMRLMESSDEALLDFWKFTPEQTRELFRGYARSALAFMREQIQTELQNNNASLDIVKHDVPANFVFKADGPPLRDYQKRSLSHLANDYMMDRGGPVGGELTLQITAHFKFEAWGVATPIGFHIREVDQ